MVGFIVLLMIFILFYDLLVFNQSKAIFRNTDQINFSLLWFFTTNGAGNALIVLGSVLLSFLLRNKSWEFNELIRPLKIMVFSAIFFFIWILCFESFDFYYNSWFFIDRLLILLFGVLVFYRMSFILPFTVFALIYYAHYYSAFDWQYIHDIRPLTNLLFVVSLLAIPKNKIISQDKVLLFVVISVLSAYFWSGYGKITVSPNAYEWILHNELYLLPLNAQLRGWDLGFFGFLLDASVCFLKKFGVFISAFIFLIEFFCLFALSSKRLTAILLLSLTLMHIGIGLFVGLFFWVWLGMDLLLLLVFWSSKSLPFAVSGKFKLFKSASLILIGVIIFRPIQLAWFDSRFQWYTSINLKDSESKMYTMDKNEFGGYSYLFAHDIMQAMIPFGIPGDNGYSASYQEVNLFKTFQSTDNYFNQISSTFPNRYQEDWNTQVQSFLISYFRNRNKANSLAIHYKLHPPRQLYMFQGEFESIKKSCEIVQVELQLKAFIWDTKEYLPILDTIILRMDLTE